MTEYVSLNKVMKMLRTIKNTNDKVIVIPPHIESVIDKEILNDDLYLENHTKELR